MRKWFLNRFTLYSTIIILRSDLPPEILNLIFNLVHQDLITKRGAVLEGMRALSTTCKDWYQLASSIPELWSYIDLVVNYQEVITHSHLSATYAFLKLSRDRPLSLKLEFLVNLPLPYPTAMLITATWHLLLQNFHRWRSISCKTTFEPPPIPKGVVALFLEHIDINFYFENELQAEKYCTSLVAAAPNLRSYVNNVADESDVDDESDYGVPANMPWAQLHKLVFSRPVLPLDALAFLDQAKSLEVFCFVMACSPDSLAESPPFRTTSMIRSMTLAAWRPREVDAFLSRLNTPNLDTLDLICLADSSTLTFVSNLRLHCSVRIFPFLSNASDSFRLSSLGLHNLMIDESEFIKCLRILSPFLIDLRIRTQGFFSSLNVVSNNVLKSLTCYGSTQSRQPLCPILKSLTLERCVSANDGVLSEMVQSRRLAVNRPSDSSITVTVTMLRRLDVVFTVHTHPADEKRLNELYENGLCGAVKFAPSELDLYLPITLPGKDTVDFNTDGNNFLGSVYE